MSKITKKTLLIIFIIPNLIFAQKIGFTLGTGLSKYNFKQVNFSTYITQYDKFEHKFILSGICGVNIKGNLTDKIKWEIGLIYSMKGNREITEYKSNIYIPNSPIKTDSIIKSTMNVALRLHYVDLPIKLHFPKIYFFVGGQLSYLWRIKAQFETENEFSYHNNVYDIQKQKGSNVITYEHYIYKIDFGTVLGFEYPINNNFDIALRYYQGLRGIQENDYFINYKNSQLIMTLTYYLTKNQSKKDELLIK